MVIIHTVQCDNNNNVILRVFNIYVCVLGKVPYKLLIIVVVVKIIIA